MTFKASRLVLSRVEVKGPAVEVLAYYVDAEGVAHGSVKHVLHHDADTNPDIANAVSDLNDAILATITPLHFDGALLGFASIKLEEPDGIAESLAKRDDTADGFEDEGR